ncbi:MAG TPA: DUF6069 family protein [Actinophytocola sp.]|uniref:DUF6069 family protein n=1 Tax=Actinophytocola sp. TaxID=1872138 RepID=UPI002DBF6BB0|nr:DUF6069 family protein [Actinophytocola sp.]HEU5473515.1 DUF6069 family protein [Actinophytocola sp.]
MNEQQSAPPPLIRLDPGRLWAGASIAALVTALVAVVGILFVRGVLDIPVLAPKGDGVWGNANTFTYALSAAVGTLFATGLLQLLSVTTPRYASFFTWIMLLLTTVAVLLPLTLDAEMSSKVATAGINMVVGLTITIILPGVARSARQRPRRQVPPAGQQQWGQVPPPAGGQQWGQVPPPREQRPQGAVPPSDDEWRQGTPR